jgi:hypothetical protein
MNKTCKNKIVIVEDIKEQIAQALFGRSRTNDECVSCGDYALFFRNAISKKEWEISHMCQRCQDEVFNTGDE